MEKFINLIHLLNHKSLQEILCTYDGIDSDNSSSYLSEELVEAISCSLQCDDKTVLRILSNYWHESCRVYITTLEGPAGGWPVVRIDFSPFSIELDWSYEEDEDY